MAILAIILFRNLYRIHTYFHNNAVVDQNVLEGKEKYVYIAFLNFNPMNDANKYVKHTKFLKNI